MGGRLRSLGSCAQLPCAPALGAWRRPRRGADRPPPPGRTPRTPRPAESRGLAARSSPVRPSNNYYSSLHVITLNSPHHSRLARARPQAQHSGSRCSVRVRPLCAGAANCKSEVCNTQHRHRACAQSARTASEVRSLRATRERARDGTAQGGTPAFVSSCATVLKCAVCLGSAALITARRRR